MKNKYNDNRLAEIADGIILIRNCHANHPSQTRIIQTSLKTRSFRSFRQIRSCSIRIQLRSPSPKSIENFALCGA